MLNGPLVLDKHRDNKSNKKQQKNKKIEQADSHWHELKIFKKTETCDIEMFSSNNYFSLINNLSTLL